MQCPKCQFDNREGVNFCEKCGANLEKICPNCDPTIPPDRIFCGICGHRLTDSLEITSIDYLEPQSYTPKFLAEKILTTRSAIEGERKLVTVLFADVANYTSIAEKLDPEEVHQVIDGCFKILMDEIHKCEGTISQFTGNGVMALFGAPVAHEDHAQRACYAALSIQKAIEVYSKKIQKVTGVEFKLRIGLNSGPVIVGVIGADESKNLGQAGAFYGRLGACEGMFGYLDKSFQTFKKAIELSETDGNLAAAGYAYAGLGFSQLFETASANVV